MHHLRSPLPAAALLGAVLLAPSAAAQWSTASLSAARRYMSTGAVGGKALFIGGETVNNVFADVDVYDSATGAWSTSALSQARSVAATATVGDRLLVAGGYNSAATILDSVEAYDVTSGAWSQAASLTSPRFGMGATSVGSKALFAGGQASFTSSSATVDVYDAAVGPPSAPAAWSTMSLSAPRTAVAAATIGNYALFAGGAAIDFTIPSITHSDVVDVYDAATGTWSVHHLSVARARMVAVTVGERVLFAGGALNTATWDPPYSDVVDIYDATVGPPTDPAAWSTAALSERRLDMGGAASLGDLALFAGGRPEQGNQPSAAVDIYDATTGTWSTTLLSQARTPSGVGVAGQALFAGGLWTLPPAFSTVVDRFDPNIGATYCAPAQPNSTGAPATLTVQGSTQVSANDVRLYASGLPAGSFGYFLNSRAQGFVANAGGSQGHLCLAGAVGRYDAQIFQAGPNGTGRLVLDLVATPTPLGAVTVTAGETWHFQAWYRDGNPSVTTNFTDAVCVTLF